MPLPLHSYLPDRYLCFKWEWCDFVGVGGRACNWVGCTNGSWYIFLVCRPSGHGQAIWKCLSIPSIEHHFSTLARRQAHVFTLFLPSFLGLFTFNSEWRILVLHLLKLTQPPCRFHWRPLHIKNKNFTAFKKLTSLGPWKHRSTTWWI